MLSLPLTMGEAFRKVAEGRRGQEALVCGEERLTYGDLAVRSQRLAAGLESLGVRKGERVVCMVPPSPEFAELFFALAELGAVIVPLNPGLRRQSVAAVITETRPVALVAWEAIDIEALDPDMAPRLMIAVRGSGEGFCDFKKMMDRVPVEPGRQYDVDPGDLLALLYTSGTTGAPKAIMHTHKSLITPVQASIKLRELWMQRPNLPWLGRSAKALARYRLRLLRAAGQPQTFLSTAGWHSIIGLETMLQGMLMGDRLVVMQRFHPREAMRLVERERVTVLIAIPLALQMMLAVERSEQFDTSSLLICGTGAAPCPPELAREIQRRFGCAMHIGFGTTETAGGIAAPDIADSNERQATTVGKPMPGMETRIVDEQRRPLPAGQVGELAIRGESLMQGYFNAPAATAAVIDAQGWYYTGDLARMDEQGYLTIVGRKKDVIIRGGQNIYPAEIESYLLKHPSIREAALVGVPSRVSGEAAWAFILLREGTSISPKEVLDYCRTGLETYQVPAQVRILTDFPRAETGKAQKFKLRQQALMELEAENDHAS